MRALLMVCVLASGVAGCPPAPATPAPVSIPEGQEGEPCAIGDRTVRTCGFRLVCVPKPVAAPDDKQLVSVDGAPCGGVGGIQCLAGLGCQLAADDVMVADAMGTCRQESVCASAME